MLKSITKITLMGLVLAAPIVSEAAASVPAQKLADSFLCKGFKSLKHQNELIKTLTLSEKKLPTAPVPSYVIQIGPGTYEKVITLKEPLVYGPNLQSNKIFAIYENKTEKLISATVLFKEPYQKLGKKLPGQFKRSDTDEEELVQQMDGKTSEVLPFIFKELKEFKSALGCRYYE